LLLCWRAARFQCRVEEWRRRRHRGAGTLPKKTGCSHPGCSRTFLAAHAAAASGCNFSFTLKVTAAVYSRPLQPPKLQPPFAAGCCSRPPRVAAATLRNRPGRRPLALLSSLPACGLVRARYGHNEFEPPKRGDEIDGTKDLRCAAHRFCCVDRGEACNSKS
jgi:hypothetical protein